MGCDIDYYLDHDLTGLSAQEFLSEFKKRIAPLPVVFTGMPETYPKIDYEKGSPYWKNKPLPDCWEIDCFLYDYETAYNRKDIGITLRLYKDGKPRGWELNLYPKSLCFFSYGDDFSFLHDTHRWRYFLEKYLMKRNAKIEANISTTLAEIKKNILPIFHCKKMIAIGDQGLHQEISVALEDDITIEESFNCDVMRNGGYHVKIYRHETEERFSYDDKKALPVWMHEF